MAKTNPLKLGVFVTVTCVVFIYALLRVSEGLDFFGSTLPVYVDFQDVKGLQVGNNVRYSGIGIGEVKGISIENDTTLRVRMELDADAGGFLRKNADVFIATDGLVGNMIVSIRPGLGEPTAFIEPGDVLVCRPKAEVTGMLDELSRTNDKVAAITTALLEISEKLNNGQGALGVLLNDRELATNLLTTSKHLRASTHNFDQVSQGFNQLLDDVAKGEGNLGYLLRDDSLEEEVDRLGNNLDTLVRIRTEAIFRDLETTTTALLSSSQQVEILLERLSDEEGIVHTLTVDTVAAEHLRATLRHLDQGTEKFVANMEALQSNWFFRGYFKRQAKQARKAATEKIE